MYILEIIALSSLLGGVLLLILLSLMDLKHGILPNELVLGFLSLGLVFHLTTVFHYFNMVEMALGGLVGASILYVIRSVSARFYGEEALGLGDVKLMGAAGVWLGPYYVLMALTVGALAGVFHGLLVVTKTKIASKVNTDLKQLSIPAGPGFAIGIVMTALYLFSNLSEVLLH